MLYNKRSSNVASEWPVNIKDRSYNSSPKMVVYNGTVTGLRISAVDGGATESGGAFVDNLPQAILDLIALYPGALQFDAYDANGRFIRGVLKAVGSAEGLSATLLSNGNMETGNPPTSWATGINVTFTGVADERTGGAGSQSLNAALTADHGGGNQIIDRSNFAAATNYALYNYGCWVKNINAATGNHAWLNTTSNAGYWNPGAESSTSWVEKSDYRNAGYHASNQFSARLYTVGLSGQQGRFDDFTVQQVLAPSTSGATIVSAKGGVTYNFGYKNASFTYNAASYFCLVRALR